MDPNTRLLALATGLPSTTGGEALPERSAADRDFLRQAIGSVQGVKQFVPKLHSYMTTNRNASDAEEVRLTALDDIDGAVEDGLNADAFIAMKGHHVVSALIQGQGYSEEEKTIALHVLAATSMNHTQAQAAFLLDGTFDMLCGLTPPSYETLYAVACACRGHPPSMCHYQTKHNGVQSLVAIVSCKETHVRLRQCACRFLNDVLFEGGVVTGAELVAMLPMVTSEELETHRAFVRCLRTAVNLTWKEKSVETWAPEERAKVKTFVVGVTDEESIEARAEILSRLP